MGQEENKHNISYGCQKRPIYSYAYAYGSVKVSSGGFAIVAA